MSDAIGDAMDQPADEEEAGKIYEQICQEIGIDQENEMGVVGSGNINV